MKCPHCNEPLEITVKELEEYKMSLAIQYDGDYLQAKTIGGAITNMVKIIEEVDKAKYGKNKVYIAFGGIEQKDHEYRIHFLIMPKSKNTETAKK